MTNFIDGLERDLLAAAQRRTAALSSRARPRWLASRLPRGSLRPLVAAIMITALTAGTAAGATLLVLRGSLIQAPEAVPPEQTPRPDSSVVSALRAADPAQGLLPWSVRVARSTTGLVCGTTGQVDPDGRFGLVGLDGRFRVIAAGVADSCGAARTDAATLVGARIFDAGRRSDVRTVVNGVAGTSLRRVTVETVGGTRHAKLADGVFALALRGYPEDLGLRVVLRFASGRREVHDFGRSTSVVPDPAGRRAWHVQAFQVSSDGRSCASFRPARGGGAAAPVSPAACGDLGGGRKRQGVYFALRRIVPGTGKIPIDMTGQGHWGQHPARTAVWGGAGDDVAAISIQQADNRPKQLPLTDARTFLAVFGPDVDPSTITVRVRMRDGSIVTANHSVGLIDHKLPTNSNPVPIAP